MFAEQESANVGVWITAAVSGVSAIGALVVLLINTRHRNKIESDQNALQPLRDALDRLQRDVERRDAHALELSQAFEQVFEEHAQCQVTVSELYGAVILQHDYVKRLGTVCKRLGEDPGELPTCPARPPRPDRTAMEFRARSLRQQSQSIKDSSVILPPDPVLNAPQGGSP